MIYQKINTLPAADLEAGVYIQGEEGDFKLIIEISDIYDGEFPAVQISTKDDWGNEDFFIAEYDLPMDIYKVKE
jgi:hypothetical protein